MANKTYALSDLHGNYDILLEMLKKICFDDSDRLYILGDCNDRGAHAIEIYEFIRQHPSNVFLIKGNHELMMRDYLKKNDWTCPQGRIWQSNGGVKTMAEMDAFLRRGCASEAEFEEKRQAFCDWFVEYVDALPSFVELNVDGRDLVLIHAGINPELPLAEQDEEICAWVREWFYMSPAIEGKTIIFGHTPACHLNGGQNFNIWRDPYYEDKIGIDGGLGPFENGQLNCLCLNDMTVTVIKKEDFECEKEAL